MFEYEFEGDLYTQEDVDKKASEKGLTTEEYLQARPQIKKVVAGKQDGTTQTDETMVSDTESTLVNGLLEQVAGDVSDRTSFVNKDFFNNQEEEFAGQLAVLFPEFKVSQSGKFFPFSDATYNDPRASQRLGLANYVEVEASNGEKLLLETAISSSSQNKIKEKGEEGLAKYYQDLQNDLTNFINVNSNEGAKFKNQLSENKKNRRSLQFKFEESTRASEDQLTDVNAQFPDISIFDTSERLVDKVVRGGAGMDVKFPVRKTREEDRYETIQPYEQALKKATKILFSEKGAKPSDYTELDIKNKALEILRTDAIDKIETDNKQNVIDDLQNGEILPSLKEEFDNFTFLNYDNLKSYITVGSKEYSEDLVSIMNGIVKSKVDLENTETQLQDIINKKVYTKKDISDYTEVYSGYSQQIEDYNNSLELYGKFATVDVKDINKSLNLLQKNYDGWDKQSANLALNFRDFAARASYGVNTFIGADGHLPDPENPDMTREEARTLKLQGIITQSNIIKSGYEDDVAFENAFDTPEKFMKWTINMANTQLPILTSLAIPSGWTALLANSFGENYSQMTLKDMEDKAAAEGFGMSYEEKSRFNKWVTSTAYAVPEVVLDRLTTGVRVRGVAEMFKKTGDDLIDVTAKQVLNDVAFGIPTDAVMGALSEGTTQVWQNWLTGKELSEGVGEAAFSGLIMDGALSSLPTLKSAAIMMFTDNAKLDEARAFQKQIDDLITLGKYQPEGTFSKEIKELETQRDELIREFEDSVIGVGAKGVGQSAVEAYVRLGAMKVSLKNRAQAIIDDKLLTEEQKQLQLAILKANYDAIKGVQKQYTQEKGTEFNMYVLDPSNKVEVDKFYKDAKAKLVKDGNASPTKIQLDDEARFNYNIRKIEQDLLNPAKGVLDKKLRVFRSKDELDNIEDQTIREAAVKAYEQGDSGFNLPKGVELKNGKTTLIFTENMAKDDRLEIRTHELSHELTKQAFNDNPAIFDGMAITIMEWAKANDTELYNRLDRQVQRGDKAGDTGKLLNYEVVANFFEEVAGNRVDLKAKKNRGLLTISAFGTNKAMKDEYGVDFDLAGVDDAISLMYGIAKKISKGTLTQKDIDKLSDNEQIKALEQKGNQIKEQYLFALGNGIKKASKVQAKIDDLGNKYTREEWQRFGADETIAAIYEDLTSLVGSKAFMLEKLPSFSKEDFITDAIGELIPHIRNFNIDRKKTEEGFGLSGWINSQLMNKIGNVLKKKTATTESFVVDTTEETFKEIQDDRDNLEMFEEEDLSLQAQLRKKQDEQRREDKGLDLGVEYSEFRRSLELSGVKGLNKKMQEIVKKITLKVLGSSKFINLDINVLEAELQREFEKELKRTIQDAMGGTSDYTNFLIQNKDAILKYMDISSLVAIERQVSADDKILTKFVRRLTTQKDIQDAIDNGWLAHVENPAVGPNLYEVLNPSTSDFLKFYNPPLRVDSPKKVKQWDAMPDAQKQALADNMGITLEQAKARFVEVRSGLKGTRKDTLAERIGGQFAFDATMEVIQSPEFASLREAAGMPVVAQARIKEIARRIDRGIEVKFAGKDINSEMVRLGQEVINEAASRRTTQINRAAFAQKDYPLLDKILFNAAIDLADFVLIEKNYTSFGEKDADHRDEMIQVTLAHNAKVLSGAIKGKARSVKYMTEYAYIDDHKPIAKSEGISIVPEPSEKGQAADMTFYAKRNKKINYGSERKMTNSQGPATVIRPIKQKDGSYKFEKLKESVKVKKRVKQKDGSYKTKTVTSEKRSSLAFDSSYVREGNEADAATIERMLEAASDMLVKLDKDFQDPNLGDKKAEPYAGWSEALTPKQLALLNTKTGALGTAPYDISKDADGSKFMLSGNWTAQKYDEKKKKNGSIEIGVVGTQLLNSTDPTVVLDNQIIKEAFEQQGIEIPTFTESIPARLRPVVKNGKLTYHIVQTINGDKMTQSTVNARKKSDRKTFVKGVAKALNTRAIKRAGKASDSAVINARLTNHKTEAVGMSAFDFDETLIIDGENFVTATKGSDIVKISSGKWPIEGPKLAKDGYTFDFSDFVNVRGGVDGPLMKDFKKKLAKYGAENMFILTARPQEADKAIHGWLKSKGINIPLANITGLANSTGESKAQWMLDKFAEGYNDMYFVDDALPNVKAVKHVLSQLDIKSDVQQAKIKFASKMSATINEMIERSRGIPSEEIISRAISRKRGKNKNKFQVFLPPSAEDFLGLMYYMAGKGSQGDADLRFIKEALVNPFSRAYTELDAARQTILNDVAKLNKNYDGVKKKLGKMMPNSEFTYDNAIRVYLFNKHGHTIPGISNEEVASLVGRVNADMELLVYAETLDMLSKTEAYLKPGESWTIESIASDMKKIIEGINRKKYLQEWIDNKKEIFSEENLNKIEAAYGTSYREALEDMLYRMETGISRPTGKNRITNQWTNWLNNSVGAIMFFNVKSAGLQMISTVNYLNFDDNNMFAAGKAFANQKQYWEDFVFIFNSDFLKQRRSGLNTDVSQSEIASAVAGATNKAKAAIAYLLKIGFLPTQIADSFAISGGGAAFYRNRVNKYLKEGLTKTEAEQKAFVDFREVTEESQQSARPDRVSQQQTTNAGRLILAFQNAPMQFNRIIKKAALDLINGRGDWRANTSRIIYYGGVQSFIFLALQNALFALAFDDDEENKNLTKKELEKKKEFEQTKYERIVNGMVDTLLRGSGITGAVISTLKNATLRFMTEAEKRKRLNEVSPLLELLNISPQIGSKSRKIVSGMRAYKWDSEAIPFMSTLNSKNPLWLSTAPVLEGLTNIPLNRILTKINNLKEASNDQNEAWQRVGVALGWSSWDLDVDPTKEVKEVIKDAKRKGLIESKSLGKSCLATKSNGTSCKNTTTNPSRLCYLHD